MTARRNHGMTNPAKSLTNPPIPPGTPTSRRHPGECRRPRRHGEWKHNEKAGTSSRRTSSRICLPHWPTRRRRPQVPTGTSALPETSALPGGTPSWIPQKSRLARGSYFSVIESLSMTFSRKAEVRPNGSELSDPSKLTVFTSREVQRKARTRAN